MPLAEASLCQGCWDQMHMPIPIRGPLAFPLRLAGIRDRFRGAGFRLKIQPRPDGDGWSAVRVAPGRRSSLGDAFEGRTPLEAAERALQWLETHH